MAASFMEEGFDAADTEGTVAESGYSSNEVTDYEDLSLEEIENILNSNDEDENISAYSITPRRAAAKSSAMRQVDLVLVVDTTGSMGSQIAAVKRNLSTLIAKLREDGISLYVSVVDYRDITCDGKYSTKVNNNSGKDFYSSISDIEKVVDSLKPNGGGDTPETAIDGLAAAFNLNYRGGSARFAFLITDANYKNENNYGIGGMTLMADLLKLKKIRTSVVTYSSYYQTYDELVEITNGKLIPMTGDFCNAMYEIICSETPGDNVVIANNIVSGFFKEPLVKGGNCDTDGDTLSDSDEVDWDFVKNIHDDGTFELYTWGELCAKKSFLWVGTDYTDSKLHPLFKTMSDIEVIPATSNPFSADTDKDYYPDNVEVNNKSLDVLESNVMFINDEGICDVDFHNGNPICTPVEDKYTDGIFEKYYETHDDGTRQERARYSFTRRPYEWAKFSLTPKTTSFYRFKGFLDKSDIGITDIKITYKGFLWMTESVSPESNGTYLLERGKEYTIEIKNISYGEYQFTVEQDNWKYAPQGGIWKPTKYSTGTIFVSTPTPGSGYMGAPLKEGQMFIPAEKIISAIAELTGNSYFDIDPNMDVEKQLTVILNNSGMLITDDEIKNASASLMGAAFTAGGAIVGVIIGGKEGAAAGSAAGHYGGRAILGIVKKVFDNGSAAITYIGISSSIETFEKYFEQSGFMRAYKEGDANVYATRYVTPFGKRSWDGWTRYPYIRKISNMGDIGKVEPSITDQQIIDWCEWVAKEPAR